MVQTVRIGALAVVWPITETVDQAQEKAPAMSRPRMSNAECLATGRKTLGVSETVVNQLKSSHHFLLYLAIAFIFGLFLCCCVFLHISYCLT